MTPRYVTPRDPSRRTDGYAGAFVAHLHGRPWHPYQRLAADVLGELLPSGRYAYPIGVVLLPRQCGKTTLGMDLALGRGLVNRDYRAAYAAQTGHVTTERFAERIGELSDGPLAGRVTPRRSAGTERVTLPGRSFLKAFPPKAGALRSNALDLVIVDESQEHGEILGEQLDLTIIPTFTTRPRRQMLLIGTAGTDASGYLRRYYDLALSGAPGVALIDYGALDGEDTDDRDLWPRRHPGLALGLTDTDALETARAAMGYAGFAREFFNVWTRTAVRLFDPTAWSEVQDPDAAPVGGLCLSFDVTPDRDAAAIAIADDTDTLEIIEQRPGVDWLLPRLLDLQTSTGAPIAADRYGGAGPTTDALEQAKADLILMGTADVANAAAGFLDGVNNREVRVVPSRVLDDSVEGAARRPIGDAGGFAWSRKGSSRPVVALVAASGALWGARHRPPAPVRPSASAH